MAARPAIFITGAASGMGRATAELFASRGWFVGAGDVNAEGLAALAAQLGAGNVFTAALDVRDKAAFEAALARFAEASHGRLDLLFNNAGIGESGWFEDVPYEAARRVVDVNFIGVLNGAYAALPYLKRTPGSLLFNNSSSSATYGMPRIAVYAATKFAVKGLTEALAVEWARHGVRVACVMPGLIDTAILTSTPNRSGDAPAALSRDDIAARAPKSGPFRLMPAQAVAEVVWRAYGSDRMHWYVPDGIAWIDRIKGFAPDFMRKRIGKTVLARLAQAG